eukprot:427704-Amphidinium_carterae.2
MDGPALCPTSRVWTRKLSLFRKRSWSAEVSAGPCKGGYHALLVPAFKARLPAAWALGLVFLSSRRDAFLPSAGGGEVLAYHMGVPVFPLLLGLLSIVPSPPCTYLAGFSKVNVKQSRNVR